MFKHILTTCAAVTLAASTTLYAQAVEAPEKTSTSTSTSSTPSVSTTTSEASTSETPRTSTSADSTSTSTSTSEMPEPTANDESPTDNMSREDKEKYHNMSNYEIDKAKRAEKYASYHDYSQTNGADNFEQNNIVIFGDSISANPVGVNSITPKPGVGPTDHAIFGHPNKLGCSTGGLNLATELRKYTNKPVTDYTCVGSAVTFPTKYADFHEMVTNAIDSRAVNDTTSNIIISLGLVDFNLVSSLGGVDVKVIGFEGVKRDWVRIMTEQVGRLKAAAPNAKISFVSYPSISAPNGATCPIRTPADGDNTGFNLDWFATFKSYEDRLTEVMQQSAAATGSQFYNLREDTKYNNMCAPNDIRYVAGAVETSLPHNMKYHLTHHGVVEVSKLVAQHVL